MRLCCAASYDYEYKHSREALKIQVQRAQRWLLGLIFGIILVMALAIGLAGYAAYRTPPPYLFGCVLMSSADYPPWTRWFAPPLTRKICLWKLKSLPIISDAWFAPETAIGATVYVGSVRNVAREQEAENLITLFQDKGKDINAYNGYGYTPLLGAVLANNSRIVDFLLTRNANPLLTVHQRGSKFDGMNAYCFAVWMRDHALNRPDITAVLTALQAYKSDCAATKPEKNPGRGSHRPGRA